MKALRIPFLLFLIYLTIGIATIQNYGINWDEPAHFMRGSAFLRYLTSGKQDYAGLPEIDLEVKSYKQDFGYEFRDPNTNSVIRRSIYQNRDQKLSYYYTWEIDKRGAHPAFSDVMAALFNYIFFIKLGVAPDVYSYNYYVVFVAALLLSIIYIWVKKLFGWFAATIATLSLALFPLYWAELHYNVKDVPQAVFYSLAIMIFYEAVVTRKIKYVWLFALSIGFAFATKFNAFFIAPTLLLWLILRWLFLYRDRQFNPVNFVKSHRTFLRVFLAVPFVPLIIWIGTFPAAWFEPKLLLLSFSYYKTVGTSAAKTFSLYPLYYLFFATPPMILLYASMGIASLFFNLQKKQKDIILLVLLWFLVPIVRVMLPHTAIYGGVRQIIEYIPAMAILSGIGAKVLVEKYKKYSFFLQVAIILSFIPLTLKLIALHPNEGVYFNSLIGGLKGAKERNIPDWGQTLGNPYRQGIDWINQHAEKGANLALAYELWSNLPHVWVRKDIFYDSRVKSGPSMKGEYVMSVTNKSDFLDWYRYHELEIFLEPVYQVAVDGVPLLKVWKNDKEHLKEKYKNMKEEIVKQTSFTGQWPSFTLTLPQVRKLLRIEFENAGPALCDELNDYVGNVQLYKSNSQLHSRALQATAYDFNDKVLYKKPFLLFAAEEAKVIVFNVAIDHPCYSTIKGATVYAIKE